MALAAVLLALLVLGVVVATAFHAAHLEQRVGRNSLDAAKALEAAEAGVALVLGEWESVPQVPALAVGEGVQLPTAPLAGQVGYRATVLRLTESLYLVRSQGIRTDADGNVLAQRAVATVARAGAAVAPLTQRSWAQVY